MFMKDLLHLLFPQQLVHCFLSQLLLFSQVFAVVLQVMDFNVMEIASKRN